MGKNLTIKLSGLALFVLFAASVNLAPAQTVTLTANPDSALAVALEQFEGSFITLDEAKRLALQNAASVQEAAAGLRAARGAHHKEKGSFDPELFAEVQKARIHQPTSSPFSGAVILDNEEVTGSAGLAWKLPIGTSLKAALNTTKLETNSSFFPLVPQYQNSGRLEFTQPLLSGFGPAAVADLSSARRALEAARARYEDAVLSLSAQVEKTYWDLYAAERDLAIQLLIRDQAVNFLRQTELKAAVGRVGPNQIASAKVFLAEQEQAVLDREENLDNISDRLATLAGQRSAGPRYRPSDQPPTDFPVENPDTLVSRALGANRNLKAAEKNWAAARSQAKGALWNALPKLDLFGSMGANGLSGTNTDTLPNFFEGSSNDAWDQVFGRDYPTWNIGIRLTLPIGLRSGIGERQRLKGEADRAYQQYVTARRSLEENVRSSHRELLHAKKRLEAAKTGVDASSEQVRIGMLEYQVGRTTAFELVRLSADLASAQQRYSQALVRAAKAAAELKKLTSVTINAN